MSGRWPTTLITRLCQRLNHIAIGRRHFHKQNYSRLYHTYVNRCNRNIQNNLSPLLRSGVFLDTQSVFKDGDKSARGSHQAFMYPDSLTKTHLEYVCPASSHVSSVILDNSNTDNFYYDCPTDITSGIDINLPSCNRKDVFENDRSSTKVPTMKASNKLKIRRRKMKRHQLRKYRKKMKYELARLKRIKKQNRLRKLKIYCDDKIQKGMEFDAEEYMKDQLRKARKVGYRVNIFEKM